MNTQQLFADAAWFRVAVVGIDILAVIAVVQLWNLAAAWWRVPAPRPSFAAVARVRGARPGPQRP